MTAAIWMAIMGLISFYLVYLFKRFILGKSKDEIQLQDLEKEEIDLITSSNIFKSKAKKEKQLKEIRDEIESLNDKVNQSKDNNKNNKISLTKAVYNHSKDIASEIKPTINEYKEKHSSSNQTTNQLNNIDISNEDEIYEKIMIEIEEDKKVKSTWAKALAQSDGDKDKAESLYIKDRFTQILEEHKVKTNKNKENHKTSKNQKEVHGTSINEEETTFLENNNCDINSINVLIDNKFIRIRQKDIYIFLNRKTNNKFKVSVKEFDCIEEYEKFNYHENGRKTCSFCKTSNSIENNKCFKCNKSLTITHLIESKGNQKT